MYNAKKMSAALTICLCRVNRTFSQPIDFTCERHSNCHLFKSGWRHGTPGAGHDVRHTLHYSYAICARIICVSFVTCLCKVRINSNLCKPLIESVPPLIISRDYLFYRRLTE